VARTKIGRFTGPEAEAAFTAAYDTGMRTLPEPRDTYDVPTAYGTVRVYGFGDAPGAPLVLLPGRGGSTVSWSPNLPGLAARRRVYTVDPLGESGGSVQTAPITDAADQAEWLAATLAGLELDGVHLVGMSIGGWAAANLAVRTPERLASVSLLDPACTFAPVPAAVLWHTLPIFLPFVAKGATRRFMRWVNGGAEVPEDDPMARVIGTALRAYRVALPAPAPFTGAQLGALALPVLALIAGRSVMHDPARAMERARTLPDVRAELWPVATHSLAGEYADDVNARVLDLADRADRRAAPGR
jgi:pimeloyl-ACP methyl ester carboxylesterase